MSRNGPGSTSARSAGSDKHAHPSSDPIDTSLERRIGMKIKPQSNGCWLFQGKADRYGLFTDRRSAQRIVVHRFVYEMLVEPIDEGCHVHHVCETKGCCNPAHLQVLTPKEHAAAHNRAS